ncbi:hypothetical protein BC628DRAFT_936286 [Trametes gibbosa]|nr:hypothetical protein BC628DRAFT_936286 [Trametes gibbosa]
MASAYAVRPRFPPVGLPPNPLSCPQGWQTAVRTHLKDMLLHSRVHPLTFLEVVHAPLQDRVAHMHARPPVRSHPEEALSRSRAGRPTMNLARAISIPAPRCISFGSLGLAKGADYTVCDSLLMTRVPGRPLDSFDNDEVDWDTFIADLTRMRSFSSPFRDAVCGAAGGKIHGPMVPETPLPRYANEDASKEGIRSQFRPISTALTTQEQMDQLRKTRAAGEEVLKTYLFLRRAAPCHRLHARTAPSTRMRSGGHQMLIKTRRIERLVLSGGGGLEEDAPMSYGRSLRRRGRFFVAVRPLRDVRISEPPQEVRK